MTDRPILYSAPMVVAHIEERKTQTRRPLTRLRRFGPITEFGPSDTKGYDWHFRDNGMRCHDLRHAELLAVLPFAAGDRLWVRENWRTEPAHDGLKPSEVPVGAPLLHMAGTGVSFPSPLWGKQRVGRYMMRWMSRLTDVVTEVRLERLKNISEADCLAEGIDRVADNYGNGPAYRDYGLPEKADTAEWYARPIDSYRSLWVKINGAASWIDNPWIVAVTFTTLPRNIDA